MQINFPTLVRYGSVVAGRGLAGLGGVILPIFVARSIGLEGFGLFSIAQAALLILAIPAAAGTPITMMRYAGPAWHGNRARELPAIYDAGLRLVVRYALPIALLFALLAPLLASHAFRKPELTPALLAVAAALPLAGLCSLNAGFLKGIARPFSGSLLEWGGIAVLATLLLACAARFLTLELPHIMLGLIAAYTIAQLLSQILIRSALPARNTVSGAPDQPNLGRAGFDAASTQLAVFFNTSSATLVLGMLASESAVGLYNAAFRLGFLISFLLIVVNAIVPPRMAALYDAGDRDGLEQLAVRAALLVTILALPLCAVFLLFPTYCLGFFGAEFGDAAMLLQIIAIGQLINAVTGSVGFLLMMADLGHVMRRLSAWSATLTLLLLVLVIPHYGALGAACVSATSMAVQNLAAAWFVWKRLGIRTIPGWRWLAERRA